MQQLKHIIFQDLLNEPRKEKKYMDLIIFKAYHWDSCNVCTGGGVFTCYGVKGCAAQMDYFFTKNP